MTPDPNLDLNLNGKRVLITGVLGGIGRSTAEHLAALGATVYGTDRSPEAAADLTALAEYRGFDLADEQHLAALTGW
ncbi:MAG TPA: NAD(P)-dependent oxidoreductase, partial [Alphaproteobacteria bacterium]|nr:NAD(P)-dependent oxidoreductase [Alphaproteobacteria bacterium]